MTLLDNSHGRDAQAETTLPRYGTDLIRHLLIALPFLIASIQFACCTQASSYPVIANVSKIEVLNAKSIGIKEIEDRSAISKVIRFIDERRRRWCSPLLTSLPQHDAQLNLYIEGDGKGVVGFGDGFFVMEFSGSRYMMSISNEEKQEFLQLLGSSQEEVFPK
jgi:hypothetical protein